MNTYLLAAAALLSGFAVTPAAAASFSFVSADLEVSLLSASPDIFVTLFEDRAFDGTDFSTTESGSGVADTFDSGFSTDPLEWIAGFTLLSTAGDADGSAIGEYFGSGGYFLENLGSSALEATFFFSWDFDIETATDSLLDLATAEIMLSVVADPSAADFDGVNVMQSLSSSIANGANVGGSSFSYTFTVPAFESLSIDMEASGFAQAETTQTVAPIPLPAAGWMLVAGLGALAAMRRRG
jgi:hypothetical protein